MAVHSEIRVAVVQLQHGHSAGQSKKDAGFIQNYDCHVLMGKPQSHRPDAWFRVRRIDAGDAAALCQTMGSENSNSGFRFEGSKQLRRHRRGAAVAELDARNVVRAERRLKEGRVNGRDAGEGVDPVVFDDRPELFEHALVAISVWRPDDHMAAAGPWREPGHQLPVYVEQRQTAKDRARRSGGAMGVNLHRPGVENFGEVGPHGDFRQARRSACTEV